MPSRRASLSTSARGRSDIATTSTPARWHASSARMPRSVKRPSPSRVTALPAPVSAASRSTYRQRTPGLCRPSGNDEAAPAEQLAVAVRGAVAVAGPDVPPVSARHEPVAPAAIAPRLAQLIVRLGRPRAEDLLALAKELNVVVARALDLAPAQDRCATDARLEPGRQQMLAGGGG